MRCFVLAAVISLPISALADEWAVGVRASAEHVASSDDESDEGVGLSGGGLLVRWRFWPHWGIEAALESVRGTRDGLERRSDSLVITADLHLTPGSIWDWYLFLGAGGATDHATVAGLEQTFKQGVIRLGVGLERRWEHIGVGAELGAIGLEREDRDQARPMDAVPAKSGGAQLGVVVGYYFF